MSRREDFGFCKLSDSEFVSDDSELSWSADHMEDDSSCSNSSSDHLLEFSLLVANLPIKRGLSQFFQGKSQSFSCLSEARRVEDLAKKERPYSRRMKYCTKKDEEGMVLNQKSIYAPNICSRIISKKASMCSSDSVFARNGSSNLFCISKSAPISLKKIYND